MSTPSPADPFARRVYLPLLSDPVMPARYSRRSRRRAAQLQRFLRGLQEVAAAELELSGGLELLVVNSDDWRKLFSYPYGFPFTRTQGGWVSVIAAADYPPRLLHRFDDIFLRAAQAGARPPGEARAFLDLLVGHEWGHGAANLSGLRTRVKWVDELLATYLFLAALASGGAEDVYARFVAWAEVGAAGSEVERADLGAFEFSRSRLGIGNLLWFQGVLGLRADALWRKRGWGFVHALRDSLTSTNRGEVARVLLEVEPSFREWFRVFAPAEAGPGEGAEDQPAEVHDRRSKIEDQPS